MRLNAASNAASRVLNNVGELETLGEACNAKFQVMPLAYPKPQFDFHYHSIPSNNTLQ